MKRAAIPLVMTLGLLVGRDALAYYNPSAGRWLNRDPIEEPGFRSAKVGMAGQQAASANALEGSTVETRKVRQNQREPHVRCFVVNDPQNRIDALGLRDCPAWAEYLSENPPSEGTREFMEIEAGIVGLLTPWPGDEGLAGAALGEQLKKCLQKCKNLRCIVKLEGPHHPFPIIGKQCHIMINCYLKGVSNSHLKIQIPIPCPKGKK